MKIFVKSFLIKYKIDLLNEYIKLIFGLKSSIINVCMLNEAQKAHARKISIIEGGMATVWGAFTGGFGGNSYLVGFFLWLGATPFMMSIYGALIPLASVLQPFSLMLARTFTSKKRFILLMAVLARPAFLTLGLVALIDSGVKIWIALLLFFFFQIVTSSAGPAWQAWMSDLVDQNTKGRYFGLRNLVTGLISVPSTLLAGYVLDLFGGGLWAFFAIFTIGSIFGALDVYALSVQDEDPTQKGNMINPHVLIEVLKLKGDYRKFLISYMFITFTGAILGPYTTVMMINDFHYSYATIGLLVVVSSISAALTQPLWGRWGDRYGHFRMLKIVAVLRAALALGWALAIPSILYMIPFQVFIGVVATAGLGLMSFNTLLTVAPSFGKTEAFSLYSSLVNFASFFGNIIAGLLVLVLASVQMNFLFWTFNDYRVIFLISFVLRIGAAYYIIHLHLDKAK
jgi:MFS family permease